MNALPPGHPTPERLAAYRLGRLGEAESSTVERHLEECAPCRELVEALPPERFVGGPGACTEPFDVLPDSKRGAEPSAPQPPTAAYVSPSGAGDSNLPAELSSHPRYRVRELLGAGGMGVVYKAEHQLMGRPVALKVISRQLTGRPDTVERFRREVRAAARLAHPNIVTAFDAEQAGDLQFLVMEYVEGMSLARLVALRGPLPVAQACDYVRQAALGLQHAHERGMVHRDIKPHNLMLTPGGQVKILDFGVARFVVESLTGDGQRGAGLVPAPGAAGQPLTLLGAVVGTPDYIAPEQAGDATRADIRADIYSLGCTLYHLLAGHPPFPEGTSVQKVRAHAGCLPRPLSEIRPDVPVGLGRAVARMMAKDPAARYQTPAEVVEAVASLVPGAAPRRRWRRALAGAALTALALCVPMAALLTPRLVPWGTSRRVEDRVQIQGVWKAVSGGAGEIRYGDNVLKETRLVVVEDRLSFFVGNTVVTGRFKLDPDKSPREIDLVPDPGQNLQNHFAELGLHGIYRLEGDSLLTICWDGTRLPRATGFHGEEARGGMVLVFRREEPRPAKP
jgi:uncharacterized protein (TIGR03067 family)